MIHDLLYQTLHDQWATGLGFWLVQRDLPMGVYDLAAIGTIVFELYMALMLFSRRWRLPAAIAGLAFHTSIALFFGIWEFLILPAGYVMFADPQRVRDGVRVLSRVGQRLNQTIRGRRPSVPTQLSGSRPSSAARSSASRSGSTVTRSRIVSSAR